MTSIWLVRRTRAILRSAEFGFLGVIVRTWRHTPRFCGAPGIGTWRWRRLFQFLRIAGALIFAILARRPWRTSWLIVGTKTLLSCLSVLARGSAADGRGRDRGDRHLSRGLGGPLGGRRSADLPKPRTRSLSIGGSECQTWNDPRRVRPARVESCVAGLAPGRGAAPASAFVGVLVARRRVRRLGVRQERVELGVVGAAGCRLRDRAPRSSSGAGRPSPSSRNGL